MDRDGWNVTGKFTWDVNDDIRVESITNYQTFDKTYTEDADATPIATLHFPFEPLADFESWTQELRLSGETERMRWTVGGYYFDYASTFTDVDPAGYASMEALYGIPESVFRAGPFLAYNPSLDPGADMSYNDWAAPMVRRNHFLQFLIERIKTCPSCEQRPA